MTIGIKKFERKNKRKGQQEIVGFVLIVMIVVIIGVVFLGISLRKSTSGVIQDDVELMNFLSSSMEFTTDCVLREPFYASLKDVADGCYNNRACTDGRTACDVLNSTYKGMLGELWPADVDRPIKYVSIAAYYQSDISDPETKQADFFFIEQGNKSLCSTERSGRYFGGMIVEMRVCKSAS